VHYERVVREKGRKLIQSVCLPANIPYALFLPVVYVSVSLFPFLPLLCLPFRDQSLSLSPLSLCFLCPISRCPSPCSFPLPSVFHRFDITKNKRTLKRQTTLCNLFSMPTAPCASICKHPCFVYYLGSNKRSSCVCIHLDPSCLQRVHFLMVTAVGALLTVTACTMGCRAQQTVAPWGPQMCATASHPTLARGTEAAGAARRKEADTKSQL